MRNLRKLLKKSYPLVCGYYLHNDLKTSIKRQMGNIESHSGMAHADKDISGSVAYINEVFGDYKYYGGVEQFYRRVVEIGPGDNCGVALLFLRDGCDCVDLIDRFYTLRDVEKQADIYRALISEDCLLSKRFENSNPPDENPFSGITRFYGDEAAAEIFFLTHRHYDFIVSRAVLEHIYNPAKALVGMTSALSPNGMMLHKVDLRDHGMFSDNFHELKFYEVPDWLYRHMTKSAGYPNRVLISRYKSVMQKTGLDYTFLITSLVGVGEIKPHVPYEAISESLRRESLHYVKSMRKRFATSIASVLDEDLSVAGFFLVAKNNSRSRVSVHVT